MNILLGKMRNILYTLIILWIHCNLYSQSSEMIVPFLDGGKWGFMNGAKEIIVSPQFEKAYPSDSGRYRVLKNGKYGYVNGEGKTVIECKYDEANDFKFGSAKVRLSGRLQTIEINGDIFDLSIMRCGFNGHSCNRSRINYSLKVISKNNKFGIVHTNLILEKDTLDIEYDTIVPITDQLMYLVKDSLFSFSHAGAYWSGTENAKKDINFEFQDIKLFKCMSCSHGIDGFIGVRKNELWGYRSATRRNEVFIEPKYISIESLADGFALVEFEKDKFGYIDQQGNEYFFR